MKNRICLLLHAVYISDNTALKALWENISMPQGPSHFCGFGFGKRQRHPGVWKQLRKKKKKKKMA